MDWKALGKKVIGMGAPILGTALLGPGAGTAVGSLVAGLFGVKNDPSSIEAAIQADPQAATKLIELQFKHEERLAELALDHAKVENERELGIIIEVNQTMRAESESEHWAQWSWRPFNGFAFGISIILIYFVLPACAKTIPDVPQWIWIGWGAILGVTTWDRGKAKRIEVGGNKPGLIEGAINAIKG
jgi:Holin of 3TMs, for gene-transfer release